MYCARCEAENPDHAEFCFRCGSRTFREVAAPIASARKRKPDPLSPVPANAEEPEAPIPAVPDGPMECPDCGLINPPATSCCECGRILSDTAATTRGGVVYARVDRRLAAYLIDLVACLCLGYVVGMAIAITGNRAAAQQDSAAIGALLIIPYMIVTESIWGATLGKWLFRLELARENVSPSPQRLGFGRVVLRETYGRFYVPNFFFVGYLTANNSPKRQARADQVAGSVVLQYGPPRRITPAVAVLAVVIVVLMLAYSG